MKFELLLQGDGNLVVYQNPGHPMTDGCTGEDCTRGSMEYRCKG
jgi:hypothetical protein